MQIVYNTEPGLFYDMATKTFFKAHLYDVIKCVKTINRELYESFDLIERRTDLIDILDKLSERLGLETSTGFFNVTRSPIYGKPYIDFEVFPTIMEDNTPCFAIHWIFYYAGDFDIMC